MDFNANGLFQIQYIIGIELLDAIQNSITINMIHSIKPGTQRLADIYMSFVFFLIMPSAFIPDSFRLRTSGFAKTCGIGVFD